MTRKTFLGLFTLPIFEKYLPKTANRKDTELNIKELNPIENLKSGSFCYTDDYENILYFSASGVCIGYKKVK